MDEGGEDPRIARTSWIGFRTAAIRRARRSRHTDASGTFRSVQSVVNSPSALTRRRFFRSTARRASRFVFYSVLVLSCRGSASPINGIKRYARRRFGRGPANAHRPLTTMVPLMVPLVSLVTKFRHRSRVKLPLAPAYRPVPPTMVLVSTR